MKRGVRIGTTETSSTFATSPIELVGFKQCFTRAPGVSKALMRLFTFLK